MRVPAPTIILGWIRTRWEIKSMAPATVMVISTIGTPPRETASAAKCASSADETRIAGTMPISLIRAQTSVFFMTDFLPTAAGDSIRPDRRTEQNWRFATAALGLAGATLSNAEALRLLLGAPE